MNRWLQLFVPLVLASCNSRGFDGNAGRPATGGDAARGRQVLQSYGCGACHSIPGVRGARGTVASPLDSFARRTFIAGTLPNVPDNLERWLLDPPSLDPHTAMPNLGLDSTEARDAAAYLYSLD